MDNLNDVNNPPRTIEEAVARAKEFLNKLSNPWAPLSANDRAYGLGMSHDIQARAVMSQISGLAEANKLDESDYYALLAAQMANSLIVTTKMLLNNTRVTPMTTFLFDKKDVGKMPGSLAGANVTPIEGAQYSGEVLVPKEFFEGGRTPEEALNAYFDSFDAVGDILKMGPPPDATMRKRYREGEKS